MATTRVATRRRMSLFGAAAGAAMLATATAAFACTAFVGKVTITGVNGATGSATYGGDGTDGFFPSGTTNDGYCGSTAPSRVSLATPTSATKLDFRLDVVRTSSCYSAVKLDQAVYDVRWIKDSTGQQDHSNTSVMCNRGLEENVAAQNKWYSLGSIDLGGSTATATTSKTFSLPPSGTVEKVLATGVDFRGPGNICLDNASQFSTPVIFMKWDLI